MSEKADFFTVFQLQKLTSQNFDDKLSEAGEGDVVCVFFWGHDCPNCEIAKKTLVNYEVEVKNLRVIWYHANIYEDFDLATRFGLFGIPVFLFFKNGKKLGKISPFPGFEPFYEAVSRLTETREN